jgi:beta-lactamase class A
MVRGSNIWLPEEMKTADTWANMNAMIPLEEAVRQEIVKSGAEAVGVAFLSPSTGAELFIDADCTFHPASTIKVCVMMEAFLRDSDGTFPLDAQFLVKNDFQSIADGSHFQLLPEDDADPDLYRYIGGHMSARELVERMIVRSGNLATNVLLELLSPQAVTAFMKQLGADGIVVQRGVEDKRAYSLGFNNAATARSLMTLLLRLVTGAAVSAESDEEMTGILLRQEHNQGIPCLLPTGTRVAHKPGWNEALFHDTAIVFPENGEPYVLTVMTRGLSCEDKGPGLVAKISRHVYDALEFVQQ